MEFDSALSQMYSLWVNPSLVCKMNKARKMTKNHYHRDDPAFVVVQVAFIVLYAVAYSFAVGTDAISMVYNILYNVLVNYFLVGVVSASVTWLLMSRFFIVPGASEYSVVDWHYSFDVHCNGYFVFFLWTKPLAFFFFPWLLNAVGFFARLCANLLVVTGCVAYFYNVFLGYLVLPMLAHQQKLMYPVPILVATVLLTTLCTNWNFLKLSSRC